MTQEASKVGRDESDLFFVLRSGLISRSTDAKLQVCVCSSYDLCHPGQHPYRHTDRLHCDQLVQIAQPAELTSQFMSTDN